MNTALLIALGFGAFFVGKSIFSSKPAGKTSGGSGGGASSDRFTVIRNAIPADMAKPTSDFSKGDLVLVNMKDGKKNTTFSVVLTIETIGKDGFNTVFTAKPLNVELLSTLGGAENLPPDGTRFPVFPRDVLTSAPAGEIPKEPGEGLPEVPLTSGDVLTGPLIFALSHGFKDVQEMVDANPGLTDRPASPGEDAGATPGTYLIPTDKDSPFTLPLVHIVEPWTVGTKVKVKSVPATLATDSAVPFGGTGVVPFGGTGFGTSSTALDSLYK